MQIKHHGVALSVTSILMSLSLKSIKVQIRQDLAMDVSSTSCATDRSLCPLPPQAETPTVPGQKPQSSSAQPQVEIKNRTLVFSPTASGESSGNFRTCHLNFIIIIVKIAYCNFVFKIKSPVVPSYVAMSLYIHFLKNHLSLFVQ